MSYILYLNVAEKFVWNSQKLKQNNGKYWELIDNFKYEKKTNKSYNWMHVLITINDPLIPHYQMKAKKNLKNK